MMRTLGLLVLLAPLAGAENFDGLPAAGISELKTGLGEISAENGQAAIHAGNSRSGRQSLKLTGGKDHECVLSFDESMSKGGELKFWAERWSSKGPFEFRIDVKSNSGDWQEIYQGDKAVKIGGFHTEVGVPLAAGTSAVRFRATTADGSGVLLDDMTIQSAEPMKVGGVTAVQPVIPSLIRKKNNPVLGIKIEAVGALEPRTLEAVKVTLEGTTRPQDVTAVRLIPGNAAGPVGEASFGKDAEPNGEIVFQGKHALSSGDNWFWVCVDLKDDANIDGRIDAEVTGVMLDDRKVVEVKDGSPDGAQRVGYAVRMHDDDGSKAYRIPGLATTNKGTLIGVYDVRYRSGGDLPGDIDVGMSRSTDGGQSWEKMKVIMDMGNDPKWRYDGIGDPSVLVDKANNRIWVAATWSHGNRSWHGSGKGMKPEETGQFMLVSSDDDGVSWSKPVNITGQVKDPDWHFILQGPGAGITMKDGTLVFPAQFQAGDTKPDGSKIGTPHSTLIFSKDHGKTWTAGTGVKSNTTEAQLVELGDGSIMINCRDNRGGSRTIATTRDLGKTWKMHPTDRGALNEPTCQASLLRIEHPMYGPLLIFSNPNTPRPGFPRARNQMTVKVSNDEGMTWPEKWHSLYDVRNCSGYSCLSPIGDDHVGLYYEGPGEIYFLRFSIDELMKGAGQ